MKQIILSVFLFCASISASAQTMVRTDSAFRNVLVEEFTGIYCQFCPDGHKTVNQVMKQFPERVFAINIHQGHYADPGITDPDFRTEFGDPIYDNITEKRGYPNAMFSRSMIDAEIASVDRAAWSGRITRLLSTSTYANIGAKAEIDWHMRILTVYIEVYYVNSAPNDIPYNELNIAITQSNVFGPQTGMERNPGQIVNGVYNHMHAFRHLVTGQWGKRINTVKKGDFYQDTITYILPEYIRNIPLKLVDLEIIAFVTESDHKNVLNVANAHIEHKNGPSIKVMDAITASQIENPTCDKNVKIKFHVTKTSSQNISSIGYSVTTNTGVYDFVYTPEEPLTNGEIIEIETGEFPVATSGENENVTVTITAIDDSPYTFETLKSLVFPVKKFFGSGMPGNLNLTVTQDRRGDEITWKIFRNDGSTIPVTQGGPYDKLNFVGTKDNVHNITISSSGCYKFILYDNGGDGINGTSGKGSALMTDSDSNIVMKSDGIYKSEQTHYFSLQSAGNEAVSAAYSNITITPNPAYDYFTVQSNLHIENVTVFNATGKKMIETTNRRVNISNLEKGIYFAHIKAAGNTKTVKLIVW